MNAAAFLLLYGFVVAVVGPPMLRRLTRSGQAPRLGVTAWLTAIGSVLITWPVAAVILIAEVVRHSNAGNGLVAFCLAWLSGVVGGDIGTTHQIVLGGVAIGAAGATAFTVLRLTRTLARIRIRSHDHAQSVRLVGRCTGTDDLVIIDADKPAAYCVAGRPPAIVVTTAALMALDEVQLRAVVAHERAHLAGHHFHVVAALRSLAAIFPRLRLMNDGVAEVSRLLEMCADDAAARKHGRNALLSGLVILSGAAPAGALAAAEVAVIARAQRLTVPQAHLATTLARVALSGITTMIAAGPVITIALAASGILMCGT